MSPNRYCLLPNVICFLLFFYQLNIIAQEVPIVLKTPNGDIDGTLWMPELKAKEKVELVIIIAGSGPTDRNGNSAYTENDCLKQFAEALKNHHVASLRFDKRGVGRSDMGVSDVREIKLDNFVNDVKLWINLFAKDKRFSKIVIAGHSEGSLIGMIAAQNNSAVKAFISIAGAGRPADEIIKEQLASIPDQIKLILFDLLERVKKGDTIPNIPPLFYSILNPDIQPYMTSWFKYNPQMELKKLSIPVLLIQGLTDIQVKETDVKLLYEAYPKATLKLIPNMNHVLKTCETNDKTLQKPYYESAEYPLNPEFISENYKFLDELLK